MPGPSFEQLIRRANWYPPFLVLGIRVVDVADDYTRFEVQLRQRWYNRNLFGTHFGGAMYAMADPFYVFITTLNLGRGYIVWDKAAAIDFLKPARGTITGVYQISPEQLAEMRREVDAQGKATFRFETELNDADGEPVARVTKHVYVRSKSRSRPAPAPGASN